MSLAYLAGHLSSKIIDLNTQQKPSDRFLNEQADILALSVQTRNYSVATELAKAYKKKFPNAAVKSISGFVDVQCCYPYVDFNDSLKIDLEFSDNLPFPNFELFDSIDIFKGNWGSGKWPYPVMTSLGCPFQCTYCASRNRKVRWRSTKNCKEELLRAVDKYGIKSFVVLDDCFNYSKSRVVDFCETIGSVSLPWMCSNGLRADMFDEKIALALKNAGCVQLSFGIESVSPTVLNNIKKGEIIEQIEQAVVVAKKHFKTVNGYFIIGLPGSTYEKDLESLHWAKQHGINAFFSYYIPQEKALDHLFYGNKAEPVSDVYPKDLQKKIYEATRYMRPFSWRDPLSTWIKRIIK